jgi:hypothetical protein
MSDVSGIPYMGPMGVGNLYAPLFPATGMGNMSGGQIQSSYMPESNYNQNVLNNLYGGGANAGFGRQTDYYSGLGAQYSAAGMSPYGIFSDSGRSGGGASPYQTSPNVWDTGASPFQGGGGSSGFGGSIYDFGGGLGSLSASPYQTTPNVFDTGSRGFQYPGAGAVDWGGLYQAAQREPSLSPGMLSGIGGLGGAPYTPQSGTSLDWSRVFDFGGGGGGARADSYSGTAMPPALESSTPTEQRPDFNTLFEQRAGGLETAGGAAPTSTPQQPDFNTLYDQRAGGLAAQQQPADFGSLFGQGVGGTQAPTGSRTYDFAPMFEGGGGGGLGSGGADTSQLYGANAGTLGGNVFNYNPEPSAAQARPSAVTASADGALTPGGGLTAADMAEQAKTRLAKLMAKSEEPSEPAKIPEPPDGVPVIPLPRRRPEEAPTADPYAALPGAIPLPAARPPEAGDRALPAESPATQIYPGADAPRPPENVFPERRLAPNGQEPEAFIVHHTEGHPTLESLVQDWKTSARSHGTLGTQYFMDRNAVIHDVAAETGYTALGQVHPKYTGLGLSNANVVGMEISAENDADVTPAQRANLQAFANRSYSDTPFYGHGEVSSNKDRTEGTTGARDILNARPPAFNFDWSNAPIPDPTMRVVDPITGAMGPAAGRIPLPAARPAAAPDEAARTPATDIYPGADAPRPPAEIPDPRVSSGGFNAIDAAAGPSGVEKAQTFLNRSVESILRQHSPENLSAAGWALDIKQPLREALKGPLGSQILSGLQPRLGDVGLTRSDFTKAVADPRARFGGDFGSSGGDELPTPGSFTPYPGFRQSSNFEDRSTEQLGRDQLAELQARGTSQELLPEVPASPMGLALGLEDIWRNPVGAEVAAPPASFEERFTGRASPTSDPTTFQSPANDYSTFQQQPFIPPWQASIPSNVNSPALRAQIEQTAGQRGFDPAAIAAVVNTEDPKWNPRLQDPDSAYYGLTQIGPQTFREAPGGRLNGMTWDEYQRASPEQQIATYGAWLDQYGSLGRAAERGIDIGALPPEAQAALLQGFQFSPNAGLNESSVRDWLTPYAQGGTDMPTTTRGQAPFLGQPLPTMGSMTDYYRRLMAGQMAGAERQWPQQQLFNTYYPTQMPFTRGR